MADDFKLPAKIIVDASFILSLLLPDEDIISLSKNNLFSFSSCESDFYAPNILDCEVINGLKSAVLSKRIKKDDARILVKKFSKIKINLLEAKKEEMLNLALEYNLSVYDGAYLVCSLKENLPLYTCDRKFYQKAKDDFRVFLIG